MNIIGTEKTATRRTFIWLFLTFYFAFLVTSSGRVRSTDEVVLDLEVQLDFDLAVLARTSLVHQCVLDVDLVGKAWRDERQLDGRTSLEVEAVLQGA